MDKPERRLEHALEELARAGGSVSAHSTRGVSFGARLAAISPNGAKIAASIEDSRPYLAKDHTPLRRSEGALIPDLDPGWLDQHNVREGLVRLGWNAEGSARRKRWLVGSDADRTATAAEIAKALAEIGPGEDLTLTYHSPGSDAGFGQVGCVIFVAPAAPVGAVIGGLVSYFASGAFPVGAVVTGLIAGWVSGGYALAIGLRLGQRIPRLRANAEDIGYLFGLIVAAVAATTVTLAVGRLFSGRL